MELLKMPNKLFTKKLLGTIDPLEEQELNKMIIDPNISEEYRIVQKIWEEAERVKVYSQIDIHSDWKIVSQGVRKFPVNYKRIPMRVYFLRIAALMILTAGLTVGFYRLFLTNKNTGVAFTAYKADQSKKNILLPDGSTVTLNAGSDLTFREGFGSDSRDVILNGEAFFNVKPNAELPFRVFSGESVVEVTGTSFSVYQVDGEVHVAVITGKVLLSSAEGTRQKISIAANQSGCLSDRNELKVTDGIPANVLSWKTGILVFEQTPIDSALIDIAHHFRRSLSFEIPLDEKITAEFQDQPLREILDEIALVAGLHFDTTGYCTHSQEVIILNMSLRETYRCLFPVWFITLLFFTGTPALAQQGLLDREVNLTRTTGEINLLLKEIARKGKFSFTYTSQIQTQRMASVLNRKQTVRNHLADIFRYDSIQIIEQSKKILLVPLVKKPPAIANYRSIKGLVIDSRTRRPLSFTNVFLSNKSNGTISNMAGRFELKVSSDEIQDTLGISHIGYQMAFIPIMSIDTGVLIVRLSTEKILIKEVVVKPLDPIYILTKAIENIPENYD